MIVVGVVAIVLHAGIAALLQRHSHESLNARAAYIHMAGDAMSGMAVIAAAVIYRYTHWAQVDAVMSCLIGLFILWSSWGIVREATNILLEAAPSGIQVNNIVDAIKAVDQVLGVHDIHFWSVSDGMTFLSCHIEVAAERTMDEVDEILFAINSVLDQRFGVTHATIQTERVGSCTSASQDSPLYCDEHITAVQAANSSGKTQP
jgi:cobalt-zinc-cadmium efflux system protein